jgi:hypothetical protein
MTETADTKLALVSDCKLLPSKCGGVVVTCGHLFLLLFFVALTLGEEPGENEGEERLEARRLRLLFPFDKRSHRVTGNLSSGGSHRAAARGLGGAGSSSQERRLVQSWNGAHWDFSQAVGVQAGRDRAQVASATYLLPHSLRWS